MFKRNDNSIFKKVFDKNHFDKHPPWPNETFWDKFCKNLCFYIKVLCLSKPAFTPEHKLRL